MPLPQRNKDENAKNFVNRCMCSDVMKEEHPKQQQGGDHGPAPTAEQTHQQQDQAEPERQNRQGEQLAEDVGHGRRSVRAASAGRA